MSNPYHAGGSTYRARQIPRSAWASNIESILRLTQRNLSGCGRDPGKYYGNISQRAYVPTERTSIEKFAGENLATSMAKAEQPIKEHTVRAKSNFTYAPKVIQQREDVKNVEVKELNPIEERSQSNKTMNEDLLNAFATHAKDNDTNFEMVFEKLAQLSKWKESFESTYQEELKAKLANTVSKQDLLKFTEDQAQLLELKFKPYEEKIVKLKERIDNRSDINNPDNVSTEINDLKERLKELENNKNEIQESNKLKEATSIMQEIELLKDECKRLSNENTALKAELSKLPSSSKEYIEDGKGADLEELKETVENDMNKLRTTVAEIEKKVNEFSTGYQDISLKFTVTNSKLTAIEKKVNSLNKPDEEALKQIQMDVDELKTSNGKFKEISPNTLNERIDSLEKQITGTHESEIESQGQLSLQLEKLRNEIDKNGEIIREDIEQIKEEQSKIMTKMNEEEPMLDELVDKLKALEELQLSQDKKIQELDLELEKAKENSTSNHKAVIGSIGILKTDIDGIKETNANIVYTKDEPAAEDLKEHALEEMKANICVMQTKVNELEEKVNNNNIDNEIEDIKKDIEKLKQDNLKSKGLEILAINDKVEAIEQKFGNSGAEEMNLIRLLQADIAQLKSNSHLIANEDKKSLIDESDTLLIEAAHNKPKKLANIPEDTKAKKSPAKIFEKKEALVKPITEDAPRIHTSNMKSSSRAEAREEAPRDYTFEEDKAEQEIKKGKGNYKDDEDRLSAVQNIYPPEDKELSNNKNEEIRNEEINLVEDNKSLVPEVNKEVTSEPVNDFDIFDVAFPAIVNSKEEKKDDMIEKALAEGLVDDLIDIDSDDIEPLANVVQEDFTASGEVAKNIDPVNVKPIEDIKVKGENPNKKNKVDDEIEDNINDLLKEKNLAKENSDGESLGDEEAKRGENLSNNNDSNEKEDSENERGDALENFADALLDDVASQSNQYENEGNSEERAVFVQSLSDAQFEGREEENEFKDLLKQKTMTEVDDVDFLDRLPDAEDMQGSQSRENLGSEAKQKASNDFLEDLASYEPEEDQVDAQELPDVEEK